MNEQEFVIGGYTPPGGSRKYFGALLVGYYQKKKLLFAGKVGTGFNAKSLAVLHKRFQQEKRSDCPFADLPSKQGGKWVQGITPGEMRKCEWINPVFVGADQIRGVDPRLKIAPTGFPGLRDDKKANDVSRRSF